MTAGVRAPLAGAAEFQTAWILALCIMGIALLTSWGLYQVGRALRPMWQANDRLMVVTMVALVSVTLAFFASMLVVLLVSVGGSAVGGGT